MDEIGESLNKTLESSSLDKSVDELANLSSDLLEVSIDAFLKDGIAKELPVIGLIVAIGKSINSYANYLLLRKIARFLFQLKTTTVKERKRFLDSLESGKRKEILSNLILVLDKHEVLLKSELQGRLFAAYIKGNLDDFEYTSLTYAVSMMNVVTLELLVKFYTLETSSSTQADLLQNFVFLQLIRLDNSQVGLMNGGPPEYKRNRLGMLLVEIGAQVKVPSDYREEIIGKVNKKG